MDEKQTLAKFNDMLAKLEQIEAFVKKDNWDAVAKTSKQIDAIDAAIKKNPVSVDDFIAQNTDFEKEYLIIKAKLLVQVDNNIATIEEWKNKTSSKIADSKNTRTNISKYYQPTKTSYYIDKKE